MRVCFVAPHAYGLFAPERDLPIGGAEVQIGNLSRYLVKTGRFLVDILVADFDQPPIEMRDGVRLIRSVSPRTRGARNAIVSKAMLLGALHRSGADVYVTTVAGPDLGLVALYCQIASRPLVYRTAHEIDCDGTYERESGWRGRLFGHGLRAADQVVTQHDGHRAILARRGIVAQVIRNAFPMTVPLAAERDIDALWVGRCEPWKNPMLFLDLAQVLPNRRFAMICPRQQDGAALFDEVRRRAAAMPNLAFIERVPFGESQSWYDRARLLIGTSEAEGFPNTYLQAAMGGTPIVSYKVDPGGFIASSGAGVVAGGDFMALRDGIASLLEDEKSWARASLSARGNVEQYHNIDIEGAKWARLLEDIVRRG